MSNVGFVILLLSVGKDYLYKILVEAINRRNAVSQFNFGKGLPFLGVPHLPAKTFYNVLTLKYMRLRSLVNVHLFKFLVLSAIKLILPYQSREGVGKQGEAVSDPYGVKATHSCKQLFFFQEEKKTPNAKEIPFRHCP